MLSKQGFKLATPALQTNARRKVVLCASARKFLRLVEERANSGTRAQRKTCGVLAFHKSSKSS
ncbi:hypothetical protein D6817_02270 [Candidatus Pacearchaeota archaeon]|nr:MAG: hypothetical protein D6817_02270 [Candidatus Pacearchaeota archaeon]